ncbi:MAG: virulence factor family protein [Candidatus Competibacteraceae bacterium]|nr:virulence factor family protein [Candidatus Competibacteraceae bacterium]MCB1821754.1 virulence factor family protein [Candidatus Competibacteraceae bacterium]
MHSLTRALYLTVVLLAMPSAQADMAEETLDHPIFGRLTVYHATDEPKGIVLFTSGAGGWNADLTAVARNIADLDYVVAGIDLGRYLARLDQTETSCVDVSTDLERLNQWMEERYPLATRLPSILLGYGAGATLSYAALAQAPADRFHAGIGIDFCPELPLRKPLCPGAGKLESVALPDSRGSLLKSIIRLPTTWFVFQHQPACDAAGAKQFVQSIQLVRLTEIPGQAGIADWLPQVAALLQWLDPGMVKQVQPDAGVSGVPLIETPVTGGPDRSQLAVMLSGDGGWAQLDRAVTAELAKNGLPTVGWDSLSYFWKARQPDEVALDLERVLRHYLAAWKKKRIVLIGFSFGADVLPALMNRLSPDLRDRIDLLALLSPSDYASFEFHINDWIRDAPGKGDQPMRPDLEKLSGIKMLCVYGVEDEESICPTLAKLNIIIQKMPGNHHFDEDYQGVARRILDQLPALPQASRKE